MADESGLPRYSSGIAGLDTLLKGGYVVGRMYLVRGLPGTGKSLLGQHFLEAGLQNDETVVYIHGEETKDDIITNARQLDINLEDVIFLDLGPDTDFFTEDISYDLVDPADLDSERFADDIKDTIDGYDPNRIFIDPITQLQYLERDDYQYRKRLLALMRFLRKRNTTVLASRTLPNEESYEQVESLTDGVINLTQNKEGRRVEIMKHRGAGQQDGSHGLEIRAQGIEIYPQLQPNARDRTFNPELLSSGLPNLDALLGGGIERGSVTFISGPTGVGKSTTGNQFVAAAADRGEHALVYLFEENIDEYRYRGDKLGLSVPTQDDQERVVFREIEPLERSAEEVSQMIMADVNTYEPAVVILDGLAGYKVAVQGDDTRLTDRLHALTRTLKYRNVSVFVMDQTSQLTGMQGATSANTSYIADTVVLLSYFERRGGLDRVMGVLKKRLGHFESQFREYTLSEGDGLTIGEPLDDVRGILQGNPADNDD